MCRRAVRARVSHADGCVQRHLSLRRTRQESQQRWRISLVLSTKLWSWNPRSDCIRRQGMPHVLVYANSVGREPADRCVWQFNTDFLLHVFIVNVNCWSMLVEKASFLVSLKYCTYPNAYAFKCGFVTLFGLHLSYWYHETSRRNDVICALFCVWRGLKTRVVIQNRKKQYLKHIQCIPQR